MKNRSEIRRAQQTDATHIAELIDTTSVACCFSSEQACPEWCKKSIQPNQIADLVKSAQMGWLVAVEQKTLVGVLAVSDKSQVKYFFVHPAHQKLGIGKQLWNIALRTGVLGNLLTVRSSLFAVPVYERLGFKAVEPLCFSKACIIEPWLQTTSNLEHVVAHPKSP